MDITRLLDDIIRNTSLINPGDIPNIDLYMDQVTTFMDKHLHSVKRFDDDKALTKTMINNYAKNDLLPSPEKKKYTKDHLLLLTFIYYYKNVLSISDIKKLLQPITDKYFHSTSDTELIDIYNEIDSLLEGIGNAVADDIEKKAEIASSSFENIEGKDSKYLQLFSLVSMLCFDIYLKKQLVEAIVDTLDEPISKSDKEKLAKKEADERERLARKEREEREKQLRKEREKREKFKK